MAKSIRITLSEELEKAMGFLEEYYVALNRAEIFKLALSELYNKVLEKRTENININDLLDEFEEDGSTEIS